MAEVDGRRRHWQGRREEPEPTRDQGWIGLFRRFPIGFRIFVVVFINIIGLILVAYFIAKGASGVDAAGAELQQVRRVERIFNDIDAETGRIQSLIQRFFASPNERLLDEIETRKDILFQRIVDAYPYDDDISDEIRKSGETTRRLLSGFQSLRVFNERIQDIYQKEFAGAIGGVQVRLSELTRTLSQNQAGAQLVAESEALVSGAHLDANTYYHARRRDMLDLSRDKLLTISKRLGTFRDLATSAEEKSSIEGMEAGLSGALDALGKLTEAFDQQSLYMKASIDGNQQALAAGMERVVARIRAREGAAHQHLEAALAAMRQRVVVVGIFFIGASILASFAIAASIGRPIGELRATMLAIVAGDYDRIIRGVNATDEIGAMARSVEVFRENIIARRQAELDRQAQERRWRSLLETSPIGISVLSAETGTRLYENQKYRALFGLSVDPTARAKERPFHENFVSPQDAVRLSEAVRKFGAVSGWEVRMRRTESGQSWWCLMEVRPIEFEGRPAHIFWSYDVTDRRRAEDELRAAKDAAERALAELEEAQENLVEAEKLAAIGGLVAGVAHEVNNPVGISLTVASSLGERAAAFAGELESGQLRKSRLAEFVAATREATHQLVANLMRAADLVQSFKQVAVDRVHAERRAFDLKETIEQILSSLRPSLKSVQHRLVTEIEDGITMESYPGQLGQVVTNLFMNALIHAFDDADAGVITITGRRLPEGWVEITCTDSGRGMSEETRRRAFDPFFTTRRGQGGTGLGLHIVYNIVTMRLGGTITLETAPGEGARFVIALPLRAPDEVSAMSGDGARADWGGAEKGTRDV